MSNEKSTTLKKILSAGKAEFLEKDFNSASLRNIVKTAGVTTGAFFRAYLSLLNTIWKKKTQKNMSANFKTFISQDGQKF